LTLIPHGGRPRRRPLQQPTPETPSPHGTLIKAVRLVTEQALKGQPVREALRLGGRLVAARFLSVVTLVVAAWLVDIETFAEFGVYQTLATLAAIALFLRYDTAIVSARTEAEARDALRFCVCVGLLLWGVFAAAVAAAGAAGLMRGTLSGLLPLSILARGILCLSLALTTRRGDFKGIGRAPLLHAAVQPTVLLGLVLSPVEDVLCFAVADIAGHATAAAFLTWRRRRVYADLPRGWSWDTLLSVARRWKGLPLYNLPGSFFSIAFVMSPLVIMPLAADAVFAGHVALAYRIFDVPTQIITAASTPIFLNRLRPSRHRASPVFGRHIMMGLVVLLGLTYAAMAGVLILADPWLEGSELAGLSEAVPLVGLFQLFIALGAPLNDSCTLYLQQKRLVLIQSLALAAGAYAAFLAARVSPEAVLAALAVVSACRALALGELLRKLSSLSRRSFVEDSLTS
jgi:O-antigen/teichoic acid export membrane protein